MAKKMLDVGIDACKQQKHEARKTLRRTATVATSRTMLTSCFGPLQRRGRPLQTVHKRKNGDDTCHRSQSEMAQVRPSSRSRPRVHKQGTLSSAPVHAKLPMHHGRVPHDCQAPTTQPLSSAETCPDVALVGR